MAATRLMSLDIKKGKTIALVTEVLLVIIGIEKH